MAGTEPVAASATPGQPASGAPSDASVNSTTTASPNNSASNSDTAPADSFVKTAAEPAPVAAAAPARPEWLPENLWDAEKGAKVEDIKALLSDADKARARAAEIPATANDYKPELPKIEGLPEGVTVDTADPRFKAAAELEHNAGLSQKEFSSLLGIEAQRVIAHQAALTEAIKARDAALGPNGTARVDAVNQFFKTIAGDDKVAFELSKTLFTPGVIATWERVQRALGGQGVSALSRAQSGAETGKVEGYDKMTMVQKLQAFGHA